MKTFAVLALAVSLLALAAPGQATVCVNVTVAFDLASSAAASAAATAGATAGAAASVAANATSADPTNPSTVVNATEPAATPVHNLTTGSPPFLTADPIFTANAVFTCPP